MSQNEKYKHGDKVFIMKNKLYGIYQYLDIDTYSIPLHIIEITDKYGSCKMGLMDHEFKKNRLKKSLKKVKKSGDFTKIL